MDGRDGRCEGENVGSNIAWNKLRKALTDGGKDKANDGAVFILGLPLGEVALLRLADEEVLDKATIHRHAKKG